MAQMSTSTAAPSFLMDPSSGSQSYGDILSQLQSRLPGAPPDYSSLLSQGVSSPLMQTVLDPIMGRLNQQFQLQNQQMQDEFRGAGALGSGAQGTAMANLMGQQGLAAGSALAGGVGQLLPMILSGLQRQYQDQMAVPGLLGSVLGQTRPLVGQGGRSSVSQPAGGSSSGLNFGSDFGSADMSWADIQARLAGYQNAKEMQAAQAQEGANADLSGFDLSGMGGGGAGYNPYGALNYAGPGIGASFNPSQLQSPDYSGIFASSPQATPYSGGQYSFASGLPSPSTGQTPIDVAAGSYTGSEPQTQQDTSNLYADYY